MGSKKNKKKNIFIYGKGESRMNTLTIKYEDLKKALKQYKKNRKNKKLMASPEADILNTFSTSTLNGFIFITEKTDEELNYEIQKVFK